MIKFDTRYICNFLSCPHPYALQDYTAVRKSRSPSSCRQGYQSRRHHHHTGLALPVSSRVSSSDSTHISSLVKWHFLRIFLLYPQSPLHTNDKSIDNITLLYHFIFITYYTTNKIVSFPLFDFYSCNIPAIFTFICIMGPVCFYCIRSPRRVTGRVCLMSIHAPSCSRKHHMCA